MSRRSSNSVRLRACLVAVPLAALVVTGAGAARADSAPAGTENWARNVSDLYEMHSRNGSSATGEITDGAAADSKALNLTIPAGAGASPSNAAEVISRQHFTHGRFTSRLRTADCSAQPGTGAVTGMFTYGNDGTDQDGDGLTDNSEIDIEVLCARPSVLHLGVWTDYDAGSRLSRRISRVIDVATGQVILTCFYTDFGPCAEELTGEQAEPAVVPAIAGFDSSKGYHDYTIDWTADSVRFSVTDDSGHEVTLWNYHGPADRIPQRPAQYLVNLWHADDWPALGRPGSTQAPVAPLTTSVDSSSVTAY
ncbi:glycoside hydrolase family 16 protein [Kineosporia sp. J2-2]|uniref:Glycoside hydrolase family 16 protein n=1 Tax=Kineosporia corallincola TaxID=2835133 RepID=A0ABS5TPU4_9ACTN|nr:glycoside hydrolase family 16 protein [Kineosporia corallincola]MBT0773134.1 glycoside hydrolase family 16 protein [Kineosporia corallincola]